MANRITKIKEAIQKSIEDNVGTTIEVKAKSITDAMVGIDFEDYTVVIPGEKYDVWGIDDDGNHWSFTIEIEEQTTTKEKKPSMTNFTSVVTEMESAIKSIENGEFLNVAQGGLFNNRTTIKIGDSITIKLHLEDFVTASHDALKKAYNCGRKSIFVASLKSAIKLNK